MKIKSFALMLTLVILLTSVPACTKPNEGDVTKDNGTTDKTPESTQKVPDSMDETVPDNTDPVDVTDTQPPETEPVETQPQEEQDHPLAGKLVINEICSSNKTIQADKKGEYPDWLEIMNTSDETVQLDGIGLSKH